jgi:CubicO group peptidase (beta-lactamase class C family)
MKNVIAYTYNLLFVSTILTFSGCYFIEDVGEDLSPWRYELPSKQGLNDSILFVMDNRVKEYVYDDVQSIIIVRDGALIFENYYQGASRNELLFLGNTSTSVISILVGIAIDKGFIKDVNEPIYKYYQGEKSGLENDVLKKQITIKNLLEMKSGISWNEAATSIFNASNDLNQMRSTPNWLEFLMNKEMEAAPGLRYSYNSGHGMILADVIARASGISFEEFAKDFLFDPLQIRDWNWLKDPSGKIAGGYGLSLTNMDIAKIGVMMVQNGEFGGKNLLSTNWIDESTAPRFTIDRFNNYSWLWWSFSSFSTFAAVLPANDVYYAEGYDGQYLFVVPSQKMVVSIVCDNAFTNPFAPLVLLRNFIIPALPKN